MRATLQGLIECHTRVPKQARYVYSGPGIGKPVASKNLFASAVSRL